MMVLRIYTGDGKIAGCKQKWGIALTYITPPENQIK